MEVRQAEFARMAGVSRPTISGKIKAGTLVVNSAGRIDPDNIVNKAYLDKKRSEGKAAGQGKESASFSGEYSNQNQNTCVPKVNYNFNISEETGLPEELLKLSIRELVMRYGGSIPNAKEYIRMLKDLTAADEKDQKIRERRLALIEKDFVISKVFVFLDTLLNKVFDFPESTADRILAIAQSKQPDIRDQIIKESKEKISLIFSDAKQSIIKDINSLHEKYQKEDPRDGVREQIERSETDFGF